MINKENLIILDFGSEYSQNIARKTRQLGVHSILLPYTTSIEEISKLQPKAIILSGGSNSVTDDNSPKLNPAIFDLNIPVLGICYGLQLIVQHFGGTVAASKNRSYSQSTIVVEKASSLFDTTMSNSAAWMSHGDHVAVAPTDWTVTAHTNLGMIAAIENPNKTIWGLQFHPESSSTKYGDKIIATFLQASGFSKDWLPESIIEQSIDAVHCNVGQDKVICALSGGVDSSVAATLVHKAIGDQQTCIFVDTGLLRQNEFDEVLAAYQSTGLNVVPIKAADRFLDKLKGVTDPEEKRKIIGAEFIAVFEEEATRLGGADFLVQGTLYPDVIESVSLDGAGVKVKSHHNVGGLPEKMNLKLIEPLRELFKDEVRQIGALLGLPDSIVQRQPFPGPGLAIRTLGEVTSQKLDILRQADAIIRHEIEHHKFRPEVWQFFGILLPVNAVGFSGKNRTYEQVIALRAVSSHDGMTADWSRLPYDLLASISDRISREVEGINRVVYDITSKPPGTIEWE